MKTIICTAGTSIARGVTPLPVSADKEAYTRGIQNRIDEMKAEVQFLEKISAETNGLSRCGLEKTDEVILLHTETEDGRICADAVAGLVANVWSYPCRLEAIKGLQVSDPKDFRKTGVHNLVRVLDRIRNERLERELVLNVTGGFKSVVPYMTLYGLIHRLDIVYLHETSNQLIHLPPIPISFDFERIGAFRDAIRTLQDREVMRLEEFDKLIPPDLRGQMDWMRALIDEEDGMVSPSGLAALFFKEVDEHAVQVFISPEARQTLAASSGALRTQYLGMLDRVVDPLWRDSKVHPVYGTDLTVYKPGNTSARMLAYLKGRRIYVCELALHDRYDELIKSRTKTDYPENTFEPYQAPPDAADLPFSEERALEQLEKELQVKERETESLFSDLSAKEEEVTQLQTRLETKTTELDHAQERAAAQETDTAEQAARFETLQLQHRDLVEKVNAYSVLPALKRLFRKPPTLSTDNPETR